ncbi:gas vesicle protein GvpN [Natronococcus occultus]|uniref:Gas vesicle protein GvpN n=1 Tax=Natronococcus occultus SP4 TaxID=694430 RepID=L0K393_9EURY|nr:gas vesicle protein GvpN [Natronococcus occultus]AGB38583.1 gas vesicle protein GvpN [Natronococcus occultus SP4]
MGDSSSRDRKVRGRKIRADRSKKKRRKAKKQAKKQRASNGTDGESANGTDPSTLTSPEEIAPDPFVETDAVTEVRDKITGWLEADQPVHLIGPTGCGKTALALSAAAERGRPVVWLNGDEAVGTAELVGTHSGGERYEERDQFVSGVSKTTEVVRERWVDNPLSVAVREGATLVYNEFSRSDPAAHNVLLSVLEEGVLERPGKHGEDRTIDVHPEFRLLVTSNDVEYAGVHEQQDALLDRFVGVHVGYYDAETEREIVAAHTDVPEETIERVVDAIRTLRDELDVVVGTRAAITAAEGLSVFAEDADEFDDELLADVFTDVLAPKLAGEDDEIDELRETIEDAL